MKHLPFIIANILYWIDCFLYKTFGFVSKTRKEHWAKKAQHLQNKLNYEHEERDYWDRLYNEVYTTKQALELAHKNEL